MGRQRNNPQLKRKEKSSERMLTEIKASQHLDIEFKTIVIRKLNELTEDYQEPQGTHEALTGNYISMNKDIEKINKSQEEMKNTTSELKNTVEGIKENWLDEAGDQISDLEDKIEKKSLRNNKEKRLQKNEEG